MEGVTVTWQTIITGAAVMAATLALVAYFAKAVRWVDRQKKQDKELASIKEEQSLLTEGILACLKGLQEQGCDGPVTTAISKIEGHLNKKAHEILQ